jgi:surface antigen
MRKSLPAVAVVMALAGLAGPALSQAMSYLPRRLTSSDMAILRAETAKLGPKEPKDDVWHNPASGNSGTVTFLATSTEQGLPCRKFRYTFHTGTPQDGSPYKLTWCRTSAGRWAIAP